MLKGGGTGWDRATSPSWPVPSSGLRPLLSPSTPFLWEDPPSHHANTLKLIQLGHQRDEHVPCLVPVPALERPETASDTKHLYSWLHTLSGKDSKTIESFDSAVFFPNVRKHTRAFQSPLLRL